MKLAAGIPTEQLDVAHCSMQFKDNRAQVTHDAEILFDRNYDWITGTEAGQAPVQPVLREVAKEHGYTFHQYKSNWVSIKRSIMVPGSRAPGGITVVDNDLTKGRGHDSNVAWDSFEHKRLNRISVLVSHYNLYGVPYKPNQPNLKWNKALAEAIGTKGRLFGKGKALAFYHGDQNMVDRISDTFFGEPFTSAWDELGRWDNTGHGNIDVIASYDKDRRVSANYVRALGDSGLFLYTDHFLVEAGFKVRVNPDNR